MFIINQIIFAVLFSMVMTIIEIIRRYPMTPGALIWAVDEPITVLEKGTFFGKDHYVSTVPRYIRMGGALHSMSSLDNNWGRLDVTWISGNYDAKTWYKYRKPKCDECDLELARRIRFEEEQRIHRQRMLETIEDAEKLGVSTYGSSGYDSEAYYLKLREEEDLPPGTPYEWEEEE